ncbi:MAG: hypothetical protein IIA17_10880 [candidate division Zixibacteria bacterium]|nr:hypothetical protein [candidate division Zixibacteria bacterium]
MSDSDNMEIVWTTIGYDERPVILKATSLRHIISGRIINDLTEDEWSKIVKETIENVDIVASSEFDNTLVHIKQVDSIESLKGQWLNVPVNYQVGIGDVQTAIPTEIVEKGNKIIYVREGLWDKL